MRLSLNEIEVTARKAALGAGYALGLAEDAGADAAWLAAAGFPVAELMAAALEAACAEPRLERQGATVRIVTEQGPCSALRVAPSACDLVLAAGSDAPVAVEAILDVPVVGVAQAARASAAAGVSLEIEVAGKLAVTLAQGQPTFVLAPATLSALREQAVRISLAVPKRRTTPQPFDAGREAAVGHGVSVNAAHWERIQRLAARTLVPATLQSRERGAGAGLIDSD